MCLCVQDCFVPWRSSDVSHSRQAVDDCTAYGDIVMLGIYVLLTCHLLLMLVVLLQDPVPQHALFETLQTLHIKFSIIQCVNAHHILPNQEELGYCTCRSLSSL